MGVWSMNSRQLNEWADEKAESGVLKLIARWGMTASIPVILAAMTWIGNTLWQMNSDQAKLAGRIDVLVERVSGLTNLYRQSDAERDLKLRDFRLNEIDRTLGSHGIRIDRLEQR